MTKIAVKLISPTWTLCEIVEFNSDAPDDQIYVPKGIFGFGPARADDPNKHSVAAWRYMTGVSFKVKIRIIKYWGSSNLNMSPMTKDLTISFSSPA